MDLETYLIELDPRLVAARGFMTQALQLLDEACSAHAAVLLDQALHALTQSQLASTLSLIASPFIGVI